MSTNIRDINHDLSGRLRVVSTATLFDGKVIDNVDPRKWNTVGSGTTDFVRGNALRMSVNPGEYVISQSTYRMPYYSGKPQNTEETFIDFTLEPGVIKRVGYFTSDITPPYDTGYDGYYLEADGVNDLYRLVVMNNGNVLFNVPWEDWDNYEEIRNYDWSKFTVVHMDFLWLGGVGLRLSVVIDGIFRFIHGIDDHAGYNPTCIFRSPCKALRYEIRGISGAGSFDRVCSSVFSEGPENEVGAPTTVDTETAIACNSIGTTYAIIGISKHDNHLDIAAKIDRFSVGVLSNDSGILRLLLDPSLSAPLTWSDSEDGRLRIGHAVSGQIVQAPGTTIYSETITASNVGKAIPANMLKNLQTLINGYNPPVILAYSPLTTNQSIGASLAAIVE